MKKFDEITLALAGLCQATKLVQQFATRGYADQDALYVSLNSLLQTSPNTILDIYGGNLSNLKLGLQTLITQLEGQDPGNINYYWLNVLALENQLNKQPDSKRKLAHRIQYLPNQLMHYDLLSEQMLSNMASIYTDLISPLGKRIQVKGSPEYLQQIAIHHRIRSCLLAGIRSAVLWKQVGGSKWQFFFSRRKIINTAQKFLSSIS